MLFFGELNSVSLRGDFGITSTTLRTLGFQLDFASIAFRLPSLRFSFKVTLNTFWMSLREHFDVLISFRTRDEFTST